MTTIHETSAANSATGNSAVNEFQQKRMAEAAEYRECLLTRKKQDVLSSILSDAGRRFKNASFDNYNTPRGEQRRVVERLQQIAADSKQLLDAGTNVLLYGTPGTGKDHLMVALLRETIEQLAHWKFKGESSMYTSWNPVLWTTGYTLIRKVNEKKSDWRKLAQQKTLLVVSDLVASGCDPAVWDLNGLHDFIDERWRNKSSIWATVNCKAVTELKSRFSAQIASRLLNCAITVPFFWPDYRSEMH
jgi:DNA replication protein DnaC